MCKNMKDSKCACRKANRECDPDRCGPPPLRKSGYIHMTSMHMLIIDLCRRGKTSIRNEL
ncbi:uncharacterized protein B0H18DRAFT_53622 [Fomitopsis serialis]|uniref:uncharacterized protein n=1 Tax=Fomitopsis serialis TaxID=139415 RepID=UPI002008B3FA|nr:uncharacterized protein B0H18DRAFT_53622 [Neoantrodia serialis]KAH9932335.1 hypothetical protein B0H18DRAFT_53622 [Neoantrodia serialis]